MHPRLPQPVFSLFIINKAGSLIYYKVRHTPPYEPLSTPCTACLTSSARSQNFAPRTRSITSNEALTMGSVFHGIFLNSAALTPGKADEKHPKGIQAIQCENFRLECMRTLTGLKFFITGGPKCEYLPGLLRDIYILYSDYALKDPFYVVEMPIRLKSFDEMLHKLVVDVSTRGDQKAHHHHK